jgi:hypothetical protein
MKCWLMLMYVLYLDKEGKRVHQFLIILYVYVRTTFNEMLSDVNVCIVPR